MSWRLFLWLALVLFLAIAGLIGLDRMQASPGVNFGDASDALTRLADQAVNSVSWLNRNIGEGFGALAGGILGAIGVLFAAYAGLIIPAGQARNERRLRAKALAEALAAEVSELASWAKRFHFKDAAPATKRPMDAPLKHTDATPWRVALLRMPQNHVFQAEVGELDSLSNLSDHKQRHARLIENLIEWHAYADQIRDMQIQLSRPIERMAPEDVPTDVESPIYRLRQMAIDRVRNLYSGSIWTNLVHAFAPIGIALELKDLPND